MGDLEQKVQAVLTNINDTFEVNVEKDDEDIISKITLGELKTDGSELFESFISLFGPLIEHINEGKKIIVFEEGTGLAIRRVETDD